MKNILTTKKINILILLCILIRILITIFYYNYNDSLSVNLQWASLINQNGLFNIYNKELWHAGIDVDYPPLFLIWLKLISPLLSFAVNNSYDSLVQVLLKLFGLIFDLSIITFLYKKFSPNIALLWAINLAAFVNASMWGQVDCVFSFILILMFYYIKEDKPELVSILFAINCLLKPQGIYLFPVLLLYLVITNHKIQRKICSLLYGILTGIITFLPFMITNKNILLPFELYLNSSGKYHQFNCGASNFWVMLCRIEYPKGLMDYFNYGLLFICIISLILIYKKTKDINIASAFYLFNIFMITLAQHRRYSFYAMTLCLVVYILNQHKQYLYYYIGLMISTGVACWGDLMYLNYMKKCNYGIEILSQEGLKIIDDIYFYTLLVSIFFNILIFFNSISFVRKYEKT